MKSSLQAALPFADTGGRFFLKTSAWSTSLPEGHVRIGISRGVPRRMAAGYRMFRRLAPGPWFNSGLPPEEFRRRYQAEILDQLDPRAVLADLAAMAPGGTAVLTCFERVGGPQWCHRALVCDWFAETLGISVPELGYEESIRISGVYAASA